MDKKGRIKPYSLFILFSLLLVGSYAKKEKLRDNYSNEKEKFIIKQTVSLDHKTIAASDTSNIKAPISNTLEFVED